MMHTKENKLLPENWAWMCTPWLRLIKLIPIQSLRYLRATSGFTSITYSITNKEKGSTVSLNGSLSTEYDYFSKGINLGWSKLSKDRNREFSAKAQMDKSLWNFNRTMTSLPDKRTASSMVRLINYKNVILDRANRTVVLKEKGMRIGFGGIGKGYAAGCAKEIMMEAGVTSGIVNAGGDLTVWGKQPSGAAWIIGIADPDKKDLSIASLTLDHASVATSGNYEKYVTIKGKKYSHTIDPKTGYPVHSIKSVTVICTRAEIADALTKPIVVMGTKAGLNLINQMASIECIIIDEANKVHTSYNIKLS